MGSFVIFAPSAFRASSVAAVLEPVRASDNVRHSAATAFRRAVPRRGRGVEALRQHRIQFVELPLRSVVVGEPSGALHLADDRVKRAVGVLRRAEVSKRVWGSPATRSSKAAVSRDLPMPASPESKHHLAFAGLCLRPAPQQHFEFFFSPDKLSQAGRVHSLEAAFD